MTPRHVWHDDEFDYRWWVAFAQLMTLFGLLGLASGCLFLVLGWI